MIEISSSIILTRLCIPFYKFFHLIFMHSFVSILEISYKLYFKGIIDTLVCVEILQ